MMGFTSDLTVPLGDVVIVLGRICGHHWTRADYIDVATDNVAFLMDLALVLLTVKALHELSRFIWVNGKHLIHRTR